MIKTPSIIAIICMGLAAPASANEGTALKLMKDLKQQVDQLQPWLAAPHESKNARAFGNVKNEHDKKLDSICTGFHKLVRNTGNLNSEYNDEYRACTNFQFGLVKVYQALKSGNFKAIDSFNADFKPQYQNIEKQIKENKKDNKHQSMEDLIKQYAQH